MPATPGTIAEYDVVLSISEDAINKQLRMLYDHKIGDGDFRPVRSPVNGGAPAAPSKYAINHEWNIQVETYFDEDKNRDVPDLDVGIFAHIKCPMVHLYGNDPDSATIVIEFGRDETIKDDPDPHKHLSADSRLYFYGGPPSRPKLTSLVLNGWKVSWQSKVRQSNVQTVMQSVLDQHNDPSSPAYLAPGLRSRLQTIDPRLFTVSSIFCLFEHFNFVNTFKIEGADGKPVPSTIARDMMDHIGKYFQGLAEAAAASGKGGDGVATPDNPFVLGYGLTQNVQNLNDVNPDISWAKTPAYFIPARFDLTTTRFTPGPKDQPLTPDPTDYMNTLNYCMLTHRSKVPGSDPMRVVDPTVTLDAGNLPKSFYDITLAREGDAIMAWSEDLFWEKYCLQSIVPAFWIDPDNICRNFMVGRGHDSFKYDKWTNTLGGDPHKSYSQKVEFATQWVDDSSGSLFGGTLQATGSSTVNAKVTSDLIDAAGGVIPPTQRRRVNIAFDVQFVIMAHFETYAHVINAPHYRAYEGGVTMRYRFVLTLEAGAGGAWSASFSNPISERPSYIGGTTLNVQDLGDGRPPGDGYGAWSEGHEYNGAHIFSPGNIRKQLQNSAARYASASIDKMMGSIRDAMGTLQTSVMAPGGEVFTFSGMDADADGQLYTHCNYALGAEGVSRLGNTAAMSNARSVINNHPLPPWAPNSSIFGNLPLAFHNSILHQPLKMT